MLKKNEYNYKYLDNTIYWKKSKLVSEDSKYMYFQIKKIISDICENANPYERIGYEILGPLLYGYCNYLHREFLEKQYDKVFFFSRDGLIIQEVYNNLFPEEDIEQSYMYISRLSISMGLMSQANDFDEMLEVIKPFLHDTTVGFIGRLCDFDINKYATGIVKLNLSLKDDIFVLDAKKKKDVYNLIYEMGGIYFQKQHLLLKEYLKQISFSGNIAVVDIGWNATSQKLLEKMIDDRTRISGYYIGVFNLMCLNSCEKCMRNGYLFSPGVNEEFYYMTRLTLLVYDLLFISTEGSTIGYVKEGNHISPVFGEPDYQAESKHIVEEIQRSAIECVKAIMISDYSIDIIPPDIIMNSYYNFAVKPKLKTLALFDSIYLSDVDKIKLLPKHSMSYYFFHLKDLKDEMKKNVCKIWFLKWLIKIPLPYYSILKKIIRIGIKSSYLKNSETIVSGFKCM